MKNLGVLSTTLSPWSRIAAIGSIVVMFLLAACSDDDKTAGGTEEDAGIVAIEDKTVSGVSQKGPFVNGSSVTVYGLDGETLAQTGNIYEGKIKSDMGDFSVKVVKLASQYALLKANGFYRNEVTGEKSNSQMTLYALTDLSDRDEVNVNLLTHLAYERSLYLATDSLSVSKAKKQAEAEVFKSFEIEGDFASAEDLNIFGENDQSAALLAISVLMQGDLKEADFSERLDNYARDIETDGVWGDKKTATTIADWASGTSLNGGLATIRANVEKWGQLFGVPPFEKFVNNFWWQNYGLGTCDKTHQGEVKANSNALSVKKGVHFICDNNAWRVATDVEKDTYKWIDPTVKNTAKDGDVRYGNVVKTNCYVYEDKTWRSGDENDCSLGLRGCTALRRDTVGQGSNKAWYICDNKKWRVATEIEKDTATWGAGKFDGEVRAGQVNKNAYYIYETSKKAWRNATTLEKDTYDHKNNKDWVNGVDGEIKKGTVTDAVYVFDATTWRAADDVEKVLGGCVTAIQDSVGKVGSAYYICNPRKWNVATTLQYDTYKQNCSEFGQIVHGNVNTNYAYFCYGEEWKRFYGNESITYGKLVDERDNHIYRTVKIGEQIWMAENLEYKEVSSVIFKVGDYSYGRFYGGYNIKGVCPIGWHLPSYDEWGVLLNEVGMAANTLKSSIGWVDEGNGTDTYGFSALPLESLDELWDGYCDEVLYEIPDVVYITGRYARFWRDYDYYNGIDAPYIEFSYNQMSAEFGVYKYKGISVRCVKDEE